MRSGNELVRRATRSSAMSEKCVKPDPISLTREEIDQLLSRLEEALGADDFKIVKSIVTSYIELVGVLENRTISLERLRKLLAGVSSEKTAKIFDQEAAKKAKEAKKEPKPPRKGHGRNGADQYTGAERKKVPHENLKRGDHCPHCNRGKLYGNIEPALWVRVVGQAPLGATVYEMERLRCNLCNKVHQAEQPPGIGDKKYDPSAGAMIALLKYGAGFPFNRLAQMQRNAGIPLPASVQFEIVAEAAEEIAPAYGALVNTAAQGDVVYNDDTKMLVLDLKKEAEEAEDEAEEGDPPLRKGTTTSGIVSTKDGRKIALYFTGRKHAGENLRELLAKRPPDLPPPIQMCDALAANMPADLATILSNCLAHGRRQFTDLTTNFPAECLVVLEHLAVVYKTDAEAAKLLLSPQDRLQLHKRHSAPAMAALKIWLDRQFHEKLVEPNSALGKAIKYMVSRWDRFTLFLRQPGAPIDNNLCERVLKKAILHRKNSLFYRSERGAHVGDLFMSLIHTAELSGVPAYHYLCALLSNVKAIKANPDQWMPWNYLAAMPAGAGQRPDTS